MLVCQQMREKLNNEFPRLLEELRRGNPRLHRPGVWLSQGTPVGRRTRKPGDQISSGDRSVGLLSISRAPVTDAIRRLTWSRACWKSCPSVGCRVVRPVADEMADFYEIFGAKTESVVARFAAERRSLGQAEELREVLCLRTCVASWTFRTTPRRGSLNYGGRNRRRYRKLHELARSPLSTRIGEVILGSE